MWFATDSTYKFHYPYGEYKIYGQTKFGQSDLSMEKPLSKINARTNFHKHLHTHTYRMI